MIHGTFSQAHTGFRGFDRSFMDDVWALYDERIFAFDHPTLSVTPTQNAEELLKMLPSDGRIELDIIAHSRGGLVARELAELLQSDNRATIRNSVLVAAPNTGTELADDEHMREFIETYLAIFDFIPPHPVAVGIEGVIAAIKEFAAGSLAALPGLQAMNPTKMKQINSRSVPAGIAYYTMTANYDAGIDEPAQYVKNKIVDAVFDAENDLVVPTLSASPPNLADQSREFPRTQDIFHSQYFADTAAQTTMLQWLQ
jgi:pimeloyl-ACP methyl ester carboxylesterase